MYELHWLSENYDENELYFEFWAQQIYVYTLGHDQSPKPFIALFCIGMVYLNCEMIPYSMGSAHAMDNICKHRGIQSCPTYRLQDLMSTYFCNFAIICYDLVTAVLDENISDKLVWLFLVINTSSAVTLW